MRFTALLFSLVFFMLASDANAQSAPAFNLMPRPAVLSPASGALRIDANFTIFFTGHDEARLDRAGERFLTQLHRQTGLLRGKRTHDVTKAILVVHTDHGSRDVQELGEDESYNLE